MVVSLDTTTILSKYDAIGSINCYLYTLDTDCIINGYSTTTFSAQPHDAALINNPGHYKNLGLNSYHIVYAEGKVPLHQNMNLNSETNVLAVCIYNTSTNTLTHITVNYWYNFITV